VERGANSEAKTKVYAKTAATHVERSTIPETVLPHSEVSSAAAEEANRPQEITLQPEEGVEQNTDSSSAVEFAVDHNGVRPAMTPCAQARVLFSVLRILTLDLYRRSKRRVNGQDCVTLAGLGWVSAAHTSLLSLFETGEKLEETDSCGGRSSSVDFGSVMKSVGVVGIAALLGYVLKVSVRRLFMRSTPTSRLVMRIVLLATTGSCACLAYYKVVMMWDLQKDFLRRSFWEFACYRHAIHLWPNCSLCQGDTCRRPCSPEFAVLSETGKDDPKMSLSTLVKVIFGGHAVT